MRECPGRIVPGAQGPIGPSRPNLGETLGGLLEGGETCPPLLPPWLPALGLGGGARAGRPPLYIKRAGGTPPHTPPPQALAALLPSSLSPSRLRVGEALLQKLSPLAPRRRVVDPIRLSTILAGPRKEETSRFRTCASLGGIATCGVRSDRIARRRSEYDYITHVPTNIPRCESSRV